MLKYLIIGAGAAGLPTINEFKKNNIAFDCVDAGDEVGSIWDFRRADSQVYEGVHLISPKSCQAFSGFPMPRNFPVFPNREQIFQYLKAYAAKNDLYCHIRFGLKVTKAEQQKNLNWKVCLSNGEIRTYKGLVVCTGPYNSVKEPDFEGDIIHSKNYRDPEQLLNKRVLVVGSGQSAIDIVKQSVKVSSNTFHTFRSPFFVKVKWFLDFPLNG